MNNNVEDDGFGVDVNLENIQELTFYSGSVNSEFSDAANKRTRMQGESSVHGKKGRERVQLWNQLMRPISTAWINFLGLVMEQRKK